MNYFPSNKTIVITFLVLVTWFGIKFVNKANDLFFQLNYNWNKEEIIKDYGEVTLDSVTYNFVSIYLDKNIQLSLIGLPDGQLISIKEEFKNEFVKNFTKLNNDQKSSDQNVTDIVRKSLKFVLKNILQKKPEIQIHLIRK